MKRSRVNGIMAHADEMIRSFGFQLPPFAYWTPKEFYDNKTIAEHIIDTQCGWDITDFGSGNFDSMGLFLFTLRNGRLADLQRGGGMCYAEKLLISKQDQLSPMHTHVIKAEDIINKNFDGFFLSFQAHYLQTLSSQSLNEPREICQKMRALMLL